MKKATNAHKVPDMEYNTCDVKSPCDSRDKPFPVGEREFVFLTVPSPTNRSQSKGRWTKTNRGPNAARFNLYTKIEDANKKIAEEKMRTL